ncbi:MAG: hypothetical protein IKR91_00835 [Alloprevotella sp.]|nr:hypothetical protein [Alloprevotella sp.]
MRDYLAIREGDLNFLAAPRYAEAGSAVLDWVALPEDDVASDKPFPPHGEDRQGRATHRRGHQPEGRRFFDCWKRHDSIQI